MRFAFVFTGQGTQEKGMGIEIINSFPEALCIVEKVSEKTGLDVFDLCKNGSPNVLTESRVSAIVVFALSASIFEVLKLYKPYACAGYSVGQYSALYSSRSLTFEDAIQSVDIRSQLLKNCALESDTAMIGVIGIPEATLISELATLDNVFIANYNSPGNVTLSFRKEHKKQLFARLGKLNPLKMVEIPVEGGWHSPFMLNAAQNFKEYLNRLKIKKPNCIFVENYTGEILDDSDKIKDCLYYHIFSPVKWKQSVDKLVSVGINNFIEIGNGNQLSKFIKFTNRKVNTYTTSSFKEISQTIEVLKQN